jgi:hypothetical protein
MMYSTAVSSVLVTLLALSTSSSVDAAASAEHRDLKKGDPNNKAKAKGGARRMIKHTRTTLINLGSDEFTPEETMFFEDTWMAVFNEIGVAGGVTGTTDEKIRSFVVDEIRNGIPPTDRKLRKIGDWFDVAATFEVSCTLCGYNHPDDDRRYLAKADGESLRVFEETLCDRLRDGSFESMWDLEDCQVIF